MSRPVPPLPDERVARPDDPPGTIALPDPALVLLVGASGAGKTTFARTHFAPTEIVSSDACRAMIADDEDDQSATAAAFELLHLVVDKRLAANRLTVVDATNVQAEARAPLLALAAAHQVATVAIVLDIGEGVCAARDRTRAGRTVGEAVIHRQHGRLRRSVESLATEGVRHVHRLGDEAAVRAARVVRRPLASDRRALPGPFDIVGDVHGCADELAALLTALGWVPGDGAAWTHPAGRTLVFVGDLVDRGPRTPDVLRTAMAMHARGTALAVPGNHDDKLRRHLAGRRVQLTHGLEASVAQLAREAPAFRAAVHDFLDALPTHLRLAGDALLVAHAGLAQPLHGRSGARVRDFVLYGQTTGELDAHGLPVRLDWAADYHGTTLVAYGHTPVATPRRVHATINLDTGCIFGGALTALRWPEGALVSVPAAREYVASRRPFLPRHGTGASMQ